MKNNNQETVNVVIPILRTKDGFFTCKLKDKECPFLRLKNFSQYFCCINNELNSVYYQIPSDAPYIKPNCGLVQDFIEVNNENDS